MDHCSYDEAHRHHMKLRRDNRAGKYHQSMLDKEHEREGMEKRKGYHSKEARAGHRYDESSKHRRKESEGMKKAMRGR